MGERCGEGVMKKNLVLNFDSFFAQLDEAEPSINNSICQSHTAILREFRLRGEGQTDQNSTIT